MVWLAGAVPVYAAPECDNPPVLETLRKAYANFAPQSLFPRRPPLDAFAAPAERLFVEGAQSERYADYRFCEVEAADVTGKRLALRYVLKGKDWEWITGHDFAWCATDRQSGDGWDFGVPECRALNVLEGAPAQE